MALHPATQLVSKPEEAEKGAPRCQPKAPTSLTHPRREKNRQGQLGLQHSGTPRPSAERPRHDREDGPAVESPIPQRLGSVEVPAVRGEEKLVQVSQQQLPGTPGEGCQVPGVRWGRGWRGTQWPHAASTPVNREGNDGKRASLAPSGRKGKSGGRRYTQHPARGFSPHLKLGRPSGLGWGSVGLWRGSTP